MPRHSPCALISLTSRSYYIDSPNLVLYYSRIMQAQYLEVYFPFSKNCIFTLLKIIYPLLLPSHNCINNNNVQFSRCILNLKETQWSLNFHWSFSQSLLDWWRLAGSNRWPPACKAGALPAELNPQIFSFAFWSGGPKWTRTIDLTIISRVL